MSIDIKRALTTLATILAFAIFSAALYSLWILATHPLEPLLDTPMVSVPLAAMLLGTWMIIFLTGIVLIRDSRPYSASWTGRLVSWVGIGILLVTLATLLTLTRALIADRSAASHDGHAHRISATTDQIFN